MNTKPSYKELEDRIHSLELQLSARYKTSNTISESFLSQIINNIGDPIFVKDDQSRLILVNDAFCSIFDLPRELIIGKTLAEDVPADQREHFLKIDNEVLTDGKESIVEEFLQVRGGEFKTIITKKTRYIDNTGKKLLIGVIHDITSNKRIQTELIKAKEKAEGSDKLKSAFLANMSHEIRTPMNSILGFSKLLKKENLNKENRDKYVDIIDSGGKRLLRIISDIIDLSIIDSHELNLTYEACDLNALIDNLQEQFNLNLKDPQSRIVTKKGLSNSESIILIDQVRLAQILSNLIENAVKYAPEGDISIGYEKVDSSIKFYVKDKGIGIALADQNLIFDRFSQIDNEYLNSSSGTGLGLSIVKELTELMKGEVWVESEKGQGATFYFTIPYESADKKTGEIIAQIIPAKVESEEVILIAEDEFLNFLYIKTLFKDYPFKIIHAKNGEEAVKYVKDNNSIRMVFMDIKMPKLNGLEATKEIRKLNFSIPIIALSAYAHSEDKKKAINAGCNDYLTKPFDERSLIEMVEKYRTTTIIP